MRQLESLHNAVKLGDANAAQILAEEFAAVMSDIAPNGVDRIRAERYHQFFLALDEISNGLRLPNLDRVLPLPPVPLPHWDGKRTSLIEFAQIIIPQQAKPQLTGREHIPEGYVIDSTDYSTVPGQAINTISILGSISSIREKLQNLWISERQRIRS